MRWSSSIVRFVASRACWASSLAPYRMATASEQPSSARHLAWYEAGLTNHHHGEDELLWPLLYQRAGVEAAIVARMERQHAQVAVTLAVVLQGAAGVAGVGRRR